MPVLREALLKASRSGAIKSAITRAPVTRRRGGPLRGRGDHRGRPAGDPVGGRRRTHRDHRPPRRGHHRAGPGVGDDRCVPGAARPAGGGRSRRRRRGLGQALRRRPAAGRRRGEDRHRERPADLRGRARGRHHGDHRHGGPHHHRLHPGDRPRAARGLPLAGDGAAGVPVPDRGRLPRPRVRGLPDPVVQGGVRGTGVGGAHRPAGDRPGVRALSEDPDVRLGLSDGGHPRPAAGGDRAGAGRAGATDQGHLRAADALRHQTGRAAAAGRTRAHDAALRALRHRLVRLPGAPAGREARQRAVLRAQPRVAS